ncbi:MAG: hypothetical protein IIW20_03320 [Clostridia bacterium]|nr:hypothetical protein [Clostridia bacterium]
MKNEIKKRGAVRINGAPEKKRPIDTLTLLSFVGIASVFLIIAYYIIFLMEKELHSDFTDTMLWAQVTFDTGKLVDSGFHYAAQLPFGGNLLMLVFMPFFGYSMTTHKLGMLLFLILFILSAIWFSRSLKYSYKKSFFLVFSLCLILSLSAKLREIMYGHIIYYSLGVLFFLFGSGLVFRLIEREEEKATEKSRVLELLADKKCIVLFTVLCVFSLCTATNGLQSLITFSLPLMAGLFLERLFDTEKNRFWSRTLFASFILLSLATFSVFGLFLREIITAGVPCAYADAYAGYSEMGEWVENLMLFPSHYFSLLGVSVVKYQSIADFKSILIMIRIFGGILLLALPLYLLFTYNKQRRSVKIFTLSHFALSALIMFAYIFGLLSTAAWRLVPILASSILASFVSLCEIFKGSGVIAKRLGVLFLALLLVLSLIPAFEIMTTDRNYKDESDLHILAKALEERGLQNGYATFWHAHAITLLSDNEVRALNISVDKDGLHKETYQQQYSWFEDEALDKKCFLLLSYYEYYTLYPMLSSELSGYTEDITVGNYHILVYEKNILDVFSEEEK